MLTRVMLDDRVSLVQHLTLRRGSFANRCSVFLSKTKFGDKVGRVIVLFSFVTLALERV